MQRFVAVDSGKFATKTAWANEELTATQKMQFRTKMSKGNMDDDAIESGTYVCEIGGEIYKIGNGALTSADLETTKMTEIHKNCTLLSLALLANENEVDEFHVAIGIPVNDYGVVEKRLQYKNYILPDGEITVSYRYQKSDLITKTFKIVKKYVYPESAGGLYLNAARNKDTAAIIDIGSLNVNNTYYQNFEPDMEYSMTSELGGQILINNLAAELTAELGMRCDERLVSRVLKADPEMRYLTPNKPNKAIEEKSKKIIDEALLKHVREIKRMCDSKKWSLDFVELTFIGGTSSILKKEIREIFGDSVYIPEKPEYANVLGFLVRMVAYECDKLIEVTV